MIIITTRCKEYETSGAQGIKKHLFASKCKCLSENGCTVKCLSCKFFVCDNNRKDIAKEFYMEIQKLFDIAVKHKFLWFRGSKEDWIQYEKIYMQEM